MCLRTSWKVMRSTPPVHPFVILLSADDRFGVGFVTLGWIAYRHYIQACFVRVFRWVSIIHFVRFHFYAAPWGSLRVPYMKRVRGVPLGVFLFLLLLIQHQSYPSLGGLSGSPQVLSQYALEILSSLPWLLFLCLHQQQGQHHGWGGKYSKCQQLTWVRS